MFSRSHMVSCAAALILASSGWGQMQTPGSSGPPMGNPQATGALGMAGAAHVNPYSLDKDFIKSAVESCATEMHLGKLAQEKASSDAVKELGKRMVEANAQTNQQLQGAAVVLKMQLPDDLPRKARKAEDKLAKLSGEQFDRAYARIAADEEKLAVRQFEREAQTGKLQGMKDFAAKNLPGEHERERLAEALAGGGEKTAAAK